MNDRVILVDNDDQEVGTMEKIEAHQKGVLHRAFSVFIFNSKNQLLLQKRAINKYHSGGLWTNTCCSHPRPGETVEKAAQRRLKEEMGLHCELSAAFSFIYKKKFDNGLTEHEYDHVLFGWQEDDPRVNKQEVAEWKYVGLDELKREIEANASQYTEWFRLCFARAYEYFNNNKGNLAVA